VLGDESSFAGGSVQRRPARHPESTPCDSFAPGPRRAQIVVSAAARRAAGDLALAWKSCSGARFIGRHSPLPAHELATAPLLRPSRDQLRQQMRSRLPLLPARAARLKLIGPHGSECFKCRESLPGRRPRLAGPNAVLRGLPVGRPCGGLPPEWSGVLSWGWALLRGELGGSRGSLGTHGG